MSRLNTNPEPRLIKWEDDSSYLFFNPRWPSQSLKHIEDLESQIRNEPSRLWVMTSGSQTFPKAVGLKKTGVLHAAESLAKSYNFKKNELWLNGLPTFHVGGLSIWARAYISGQQVGTFEEWEPLEFHERLKSSQATWTSLVPTQVFDLLQHDLISPAPLRGVFVGGGPLREDLYRAGRELGWPLLPTYGMTEAASQVATAPLESLKARTLPSLLPLPHIQIHINEEGRIGLKSECVADRMAYWEQGKWKLQDPRDPEQIYWTADCGGFENQKYLYVLGRADDFKKIRGELVSLSQLQSRLDQSLLELRKDLVGVVHFLPDPRTSYKVVLVLESSLKSSGPEILQKMSSKCAPYEAPEACYIVDRLPKSELGKIKRADLDEMLRSLKPES